MKLDIQKLHISHCLEKHPILSEKIKYKTRYLNVLEYFVLKYSPEDRFAIAMLDNYKKVFLRENIETYSYKNKTLKAAAWRVSGLKIKNFKLFTYRYSLLCDCLLLNAFSEPAKAIEIVNEIKEAYKKRYHTKLDRLYATLYNGEHSLEGLDKVQFQVECWKANREHLSKIQSTILTTATMSAGKSTLINALVGKRMNQTKNEACTAKLHYIFDKAFEDDFSYELDHELNLDASHEILMEDNELNNCDDIFVSTFFRAVGSKRNRLCIIDTPGVNSSLNADHARITMDGVTNKEFEKLLYIINAEQVGTNDDIKYLQFISENVDKSKAVFVLNKLDRFKLNEDSISESVEKLKTDLTKLGFGDPIICPVSSYAGLLAKKRIFKEPLSEDEVDEYELLKRKFRKSEYNLSVYYPQNVLNVVTKVGINYSLKHSEDIDLLMKSGMLCLEEIILREE